MPIERTTRRLGSCRSTTGLTPTAEMTRGGAGAASGGCQILIEILRRIDNLRRPAVLGRAGGSVGPCEDRTASSPHRSGAAVLQLLLFGEQEGQAGARTPARGADILRRIGPVAGRHENAHRLLVEVHELGDLCVERHRPFPAIPVIGRLGVQAEGHAVLGGVGNEGLEIGLVDVRVVRVARE